jgi:hypothetical protein
VEDKTICFWSIVFVDARDTHFRCKQTYDAWREGRDEDEDDENEEYDDMEEQAYVLFKLEVSVPSSQPPVMPPSEHAVIPIHIKPTHRWSAPTPSAAPSPGWWARARPRRCGAAA